MNSTLLIKSWATILSLMLVLSVSSCSPSSRDTQSRLARAESLMQEHPDSALSIIESIDASTIHSRSLKASYALRYSQALDKNAIFLTSDSILIPAIDYYSENGSTQEKMLTMYYHGRIFMNAGNYSQAIISFIEAAQLAIDINDNLQLGLIYNKIALCNNWAYNYEENLKYAQKAADAFRKCGINRYSLGASLSLGIAYYNNGKYARSKEIYDSILTIAIRKNDTSTVSRCLTAQANLQYETQEYQRAKTSLIEISNRWKHPLNCNELCILARIYSIEGKQDSSYYYSIKARDCVYSISDSTAYLDMMRTLMTKQQNYKAALEYLQTAISFQDTMIKKASSSTAIVAQRDYFQNKAQQQAIEYDEHKQYWIIGSISMAILAGASLFLFWLRTRHRKKIYELESSEYMLQLMTVNKTIQEMKQRESIMAQKIEQLFHNRFELLDRFCDSYYSNQGREKEQAIVHAEMMALLDEFRDKNKTNAIEEIINSCYDNVLLKIREEFPSLKQRDITFLCYLLVGFSSRTISILLQEKIESVYRHKSRIKLTIERSDSPNKQHFSWIFSQQADGH